MAGRGLIQRVQALEGPKGKYAGITRWHWVLQEVGETEDDALARYQAQHGAIGPTEGIIRWRTAAPCHA